MAKLITRSILVLGVCALAVITTSRARADEYPLVNGDFWEVSGIHIKDGGTLAYATFIAGEWRKDQEFAKSKGWIKSYMVLANNHARKGEPDVYLITVSDKLPSGPESEKMLEEYMAWSKASIAQLEKESGDRTEFREVGSTLLLQELKFRN